MEHELQAFLAAAEKQCRIGGHCNGLRSSIWNIWSSKTDLYLSQRATRKCLKVSFHSSGKFRLAFDESYHAALKGDGIVPPEKDRVITRWKRPEERSKSAVLVASILLPARHYTKPINDDDVSLGTQLFGVDPANSLEVGIFHSAKFAEDLEVKLSRVGRPIWYSDLDSLGTFSVVIRQRPTDPENLLRTELQVPLESFHDRSILPIKDDDVVGGLGVLLFNDAEKEGLLRVVEISGARLRKTTTT